MAQTQINKVLNFLQKGYELSSKEAAQPPTIDKPFVIYYLSGVIKRLRERGIDIRDYNKNGFTYYFLFREDKQMRLI